MNPRALGAEMEGSINTLVEDLLRPTEGVTRAIAAVAQGNLNSDRNVWMSMVGRWKASSSALQTSSNTMIQQLGVFNRRSDARGARSGY